MKTLQHIISYEELAPNELSADVLSLIEEAKKATEASYSPFSHFQVGAAARLQNGAVVRGCNQENDAYPSGLCAERTALFAAGAQYPDVPVLQLAIAAQTGGAFIDEPITPCGGCAQVLLQTEMRSKTPLHIYLYGKNRVLHLTGVKSILPFAFTL